MDYAKEIIESGMSALDEFMEVGKTTPFLAERDRLLALASLWQKPEELRAEPGLLCYKHPRSETIIQYFDELNDVPGWCERRKLTALFVIYESDLLATLPKEDAA